MQDPNASNPQIPQPNNTMVRLSSLGGRVLRRVKEQASVQPVTNHYPTGVVGKPVYMPQFRIALVHNPNNSPKYAQFRVPLSFNKFDLRSYLWNLYGVGVLGIRSYVQAQGITRITRDGKGYGPWRRPKSQKRMTVELKEPFAWPEAPKDMAPFEFESWKKAELWQKEQQDSENPKRNSGEEPDHKLRAAFKEQAEALRGNKETWRPTWKALGLEPHEVAKASRTIPATQPAWYSRQRKAGSK
ncbi:unnamed protein product [Penicillium salamii]|nr:unnamed protein product [Penicillium salamii]